MQKIVYEEFGVRSEVLEYHNIGPMLKGMRAGKPFIHDNEIRINIDEDLYKIDLIRFYSLSSGEELSRSEVYLDTELRIATAIINEKKEILLLKVDRPSKTFYCFPGGHKRENESVQECLQREMKEETDIDITNFHAELICELQTGGFGPEMFFMVNIGNNKIEFKDEDPDNEQVKLEVISVDEMFSIDNVFPKEVVDGLRKLVEGLYC